MFLHVQTFGKQYSIHVKDDQTLKDVVKEAMDYWKQTETEFTTKDVEGKELDLEKTPEDNWLNSNDYVIVTKPS